MGSKILPLLKNLLRNRNSLIGLTMVSFFLVIALLAPILAPHNPTHIFPESLRVPPFWSADSLSQFLLGTDDVGRDLLSRLLYGSRVSLGIGLLVVLFSGFFGISLGLIAGYMGGRVDNLIMRAVDLIMALPSILLAIVVVSILGPGLLNSVIAVGIVAMPGFIRLTRASVLSEKKKDYVQAAISLGAGHPRILLLNIFPNCLAPLIVQATMGLSDGILSVAALGFLGLGAQPPTPEWGTMLADTRAYIESSPFLVTLPGLCILIVVLGLNLFGDGLRDVLDPKLKK